MIPIMTPLRDYSPSRLAYSYSRTSPVRIITPYPEPPFLPPPLIKECPRELCEKVVKVLRTIAVDESDIERLRQLFGQMREFTRDQKALFKSMDKDEDGTVTEKELTDFLAAQKVKDEQYAREIIAEFDSTQDGKLDVDEFLNIFLPAGGVGLRAAEWYPDPRAQPADGDLPASVTSQAARILEREIAFLKNRSAAWEALASESEESLAELFNQIGRGRPEIMMTDLIWFCERYGFMPSTEDLEAILRRCDHDADRCLTFEEFAEMIGRSHEELMAERKAREEKSAKEREADLEKWRAEREAEKAEYEKKLEEDKLAREKRLEELRAEAEKREVDRQAQLELWRLEREAEIQKAREAEEQRRKEIETAVELERAERERRLAEAQKELAARRAEREAELEKAGLEREAAIEAHRKEAEARRSEYEKELELQRLEREKRIDEARAE